MKKICTRIFMQALCCAFLFKSSAAISITIDFDSDPGFMPVVHDPLYAGNCEAYWDQSRGDFYAFVRDQSHAPWWCLSESPIFDEVSIMYLQTVTILNVNPYRPTQNVD